MDSNHKDLKVDVSNNGSNSLESPKVVRMEEREEDDDESQALLPSDKLSPVSEKPKRKVQWLDTTGDKLAQVVEFEPSDNSDSEGDDSDSCFCRLM